MTTRGVNFFEQHFLLSNRLVQLVLGLRPYQNWNGQLITLCIITIFLFPGIFYQLYQLFISNLTLQTIKELQKTIPSIIMFIAYSISCLSFKTIKLIIIHFKLDYEELFDEEELNIMKEYTRETKLYAYSVIVFFNLYGISIIFSSILNVFLYLFDILEDNQLTLINPVNNVSNASALFFSLLIYQIISSFIFLIVGSVFYSTYLVFIQHACCQFSVIILKIRQPFKKNQKCMENTWNDKSAREEWDWIIDIIKRYRKVSEYIDLINRVSKINYLIAIFFAMILIAFDFIFLFHLYRESLNVIEIMESSFYITASVFTTYINFYIGQKLLNYNDAAFDELCNIPFYMLSINTQKLLLFMIVRSGKPCVLSIGDMFVSSHEVFIGIESTETV
ncbi:uncharacterized protein LOC124953545 [Vespa velutina]|uniref:uncharacterized protein LOC124953545 n=1 Tax=Vespa velutina TaxID=202808 RepID=UPI001FB41BC8|nr:uncharacterized protein LOC124953545 [Vespa velutina]